MKRSALIVAAVWLASCGGGSHDCAIGSLTGTWRLTYAQTDGNCGPISAETVQAGTPGSPSCSIASRQISPDKCRLDTSFTCPTTDNRGTQSWVAVLHQDSSTQLSGTGTVQVNHPAGTCRSTYNLTMTKL